MTGRQYVSRLADSVSCGRTSLPACDAGYRISLCSQPYPQSGGHAFIQNLRRGHYELGMDARPGLTLAAAFDELALVV
jgi:hypothetical protein